MKNVMKSVRAKALSVFAALSVVLQFPAKAINNVYATLRRVAVTQINQLLSAAYHAFAERVLRATGINIRTRSGAVLIGAVISLGVLVIVIPIVYLIAVQVGNTLPATALSQGQSSTLVTLINNGGAALQLTTVSETVVGAGIILLGIFLFFQMRR